MHIYSRGMTLVELMVAMAIGVFLIGGALTMYVQSRGTMLVNDSLARMQEHARFAIDLLEPDVRLANFWGLHNWSEVVEGRATDAAPLPTPIGNDCAANWTIDLDNAVEGFNGVHPGWPCLPVPDYKDATDILVVRHVKETPVVAADLVAGKVYLRSDESPRGLLFVGLEPGGFSPQAENHELVVHAYYVRPYSFAVGDGMPSLRRMVLTDAGAAPAIQDREVIAGVEDLQVQFGIDTNGIGGAADDGSANLYVDPDNPILGQPGVRVVAVRIWLLMRSLDIEEAFVDQAQYTYADLDFTIDERADLPQGFRRFVVSRTIELRNL